MTSQRTAGPLLALLLLGGSAQAQTPPEAPRPGWTWLPGPARSVPRTSSASRDTPLLEFAYGPRAQASLGAEFGLLRFHGERAVVSVGMYGMVALANGTQPQLFPPHELWRGLVGWSGSVALPSLSRSLFGDGALLELSLLLGHESDHGDRPDAPQQHDFPEGGGGDFLTPDVALRLRPAPGWELGVRLQDRLFVRGSAAQSPGADLWIRRSLGLRVAPLLALNGEQLVPTEPFVRRAFTGRALLGVALPGRVGEVLPFVAGEAGNDRGLLINRRELRLSFGVRYVVF